MSSTVIDSVPALVPGATILDELVEARGPWSAIVKAGDVLTIVDRLLHVRAQRHEVVARLGLRRL